MVNAKAPNRLMEAKVGIVFSHQLAVVGTGRPQLLNKQVRGPEFGGTLQSIGLQPTVFAMVGRVGINNAKATSNSIR